MALSLLDQFLAEECSSYVRQLLESAIKDASNLRPHFEFNRFEVTVNRDAASVIIEDVLDATDSGSQQLSLSDFVKVLV